MALPSARSSGTATRYENAFLYGPNRSVGRYRPEVSAETLPTVTMRDPGPAVFDPAPPPAPLPPPPPPPRSEPPPPIVTDYAPDDDPFAAGGGEYEDVPFYQGRPGADLLTVLGTGLATSILPRVLGPMLRPGAPSTELPMEGGGSDLAGADLGYQPGYGGLDLGGAGAGDIPAGPIDGGGWEGSGADVGASLGDMSLSGLTGYSAPVDLGSLGTFDAVNTIGSLGLTYGAGQAGKALSPDSDPDDWAAPLALQAIGTVLGYGTGTGPLFPTLAAFVGGFIDGEADHPYAYATGGISANEQGAGFAVSDPGALNHANAGSFRPGADSLENYLLARMQAEGYVPNAEMVNRQGFVFGQVGPQSGMPRFFYGAGEDVNAGRIAWQGDADWRGSDFGQLADFAWNDLTSRNYFTRPGTTTSWSDVYANLQADPLGQGGQQFMGGGEGSEVWAPGADVLHRTFASPQQVAAAQGGAVPVDWSGGAG